MTFFVIPLAPHGLFSCVTIFLSGFEITIEHPHTDVVRCSQLVRGTSNFIIILIHKQKCNLSYRPKGKPLVKNVPVAVLRRSPQSCQLMFAFCVRSEQGLGPDILFHGYQQVVTLTPICCTVTAPYDFLFCRVLLPAPDAPSRLGAGVPPALGRGARAARRGAV